MLLFVGNPRCLLDLSASAKLHFPTNCSSLILDFFSDCHLLILNLLLILITPHVLIITSRLCVGR